MKKNYIKGILISIASLAVGYFAIAVPFKFFESLTSQQMTIMFVTELVVYTIVGMVFLTVRQLEQNKKAKQKLQERKNTKITKLDTSWYDLVA